MCQNLTLLYERDMFLIICAKEVRAPAHSITTAQQARNITLSNKTYIYESWSIASNWHDLNHIRVRDNTVIVAVANLQWYACTPFLIQKKNEIPKNHHYLIVILIFHDKQWSLKWVLVVSTLRKIKCEWLNKYERNGRVKLFKMWCLAWNNDAISDYDRSKHKYREKELKKKKKILVLVSCVYS